MSRFSAFAYAQARLQARHGMRPDDRTWRGLQGIRELSGYLQMVRHLPLRPWVLGLSARHTPHEMELELRRRYLAYIRDVARWQPRGWRPAVLWVGRLVDLPMLEHLLAGRPAPRWLVEIPELQAFASESLALRLEAMEGSDCAPLLQAWHHGMALPQGWAIHWRRLWPRSPGAVREPLARLGAALGRHAQALAAPAAPSSAKARARLAVELERAFRRHTQQPAAAFAHLALVGLDLARLRGDLMHRALFVIPGDHRS
jgi:hypothetical protein